MATEPIDCQVCRRGKLEQVLSRVHSPEVVFWGNVWCVIMAVSLIATVIMVIIVIAESQKKVTVIHESWGFVLTKYTCIIAPPTLTLIAGTISAF